MSTTRATAYAGDSGSPNETFAALLARGFWPIVIYPRGATIPGRDKPSEGKEPIGNGWGLERCTVDLGHRRFKQWPRAGVGICLGPGRGPGGDWLVDVEGDGPEAEASRAILFGGEVIETMGWASTRGNHTLLVCDGNRLAQIMPAIKSLEVKGTPSLGVYKSPSLPGLELRIGGHKTDGAVKQVQSVCPPTPGTDGQPRTWIGPKVIAKAPESFYNVLASLIPTARPKVETKRPRTVQAVGSSDAQLAAEALTYLDPDIDYLGWLEIGMSLTPLGQEGLNLWEQWSSHSTKYLAGETPRKWASFDTNGCTLGTLFHRAKARGFEFPKNGHHSSNGKAHQSGETPRDPKPQAAQSNPERPDESMPRFGNYHFEEFVDEEGRRKLKPFPHSMPKIVADLGGLLNGWPKRVQERLFIESDRREPVYLNSATRLFSWIDQRSHVDWTKGSRFITQERFYENRRMNAERYESIEVMPHVPLMPGAYYMHRELPEPSGKLDHLVDRFLPATEADRQLIKSLIVTPLWGGMPGTRPAFLVTGPEFDPEQGRGLGKTSMLDLIANELYGGALAISQGEDIGIIKTRILSEEGSSRRIMRLDNVKTLRFSWSDLEDMITAPNISGRMLYVGEGRRINDLVWIITLNGASLSKDMAQRVVTIKLARPSKKPPEWRDETAAFMRENRWEILADVAQLLKRPAGWMTPKTRWAAWERDILSKLIDPESCQAAIIERQEVVDEGNGDREIIRDALRAKIVEHGYDPDLALLKIPSKTMAEIASEAMRRHYETAAATTFVKGLSIVELIANRSSDCRGWIWNGGQTTETDPVLFAPIPKTR
jgi:hypothetical protein